MPGSSSATPPSAPVVYSIASSTPHSGRYSPDNIIEDKPLDQSSRWSGAFQGNANQWIVLKLNSLAILKTITFGKFSKPHPCNVKELKVLVGTSEDHMTEILHAGLKNDTVPETFILNHVNGAGVAFPTLFVKIIPMMAHGQNFHISIWHVSVTGIIEPEYVERTRVAYEEYRETAVLRHILKHLRQRRLLSPFQAVLSRANIQLEHPLITHLHESLVLQGDWVRSEQLLDEISSSGLFESYLITCQPYAEWTRLSGTDADGDVPPARGGHAMCMDPINEMIYIFGGWNGEKSLDDFWVYSIREDKWKLLSHSTTDEQNAPGARSCHKMVFDSKTGSIYVLGRLNDADGLRAPASSSPRPSGPPAPAPYPIPPPHQAQPQPPVPSQPHPQEQRRQSESAINPDAKMYSSEFYRYHTRGLLAGKWDFLSIDTAASGGPPLVFDHQMVMDSESQMLYVFGGRVVDGDWDVSKYSGLYSYNVSTSKWRLLQYAQPVPGPPEVQMHPRTSSLEASVGSNIIPSRFGHSMVLDPSSKKLYIFAGQREDKYLSDMYAYDIRTNIATEIFSNFSAAGGPEACFTQRAVVDPVLKEIYVFCGLTRTTSVTGPLHALRDDLLNWVYRYDARPGKWMQILRQPETSASQRPMPRFAHQVVYNPNTRTVFLHGGNAGGTLGSRSSGRDDEDVGAGPQDPEETRENSGAKERLDDFWRMQLRRPGPEEIIRQGKFMIRRQQFREMCEEMAPIKALGFLQKEVASVVDHKNKQEEEQFRSLLTHLLSPSPVSEKPPQSSRPSSSSSSRSTVNSIKHEDSREGSPRPRKRSRGDREGSISEESGVWTNELPPVETEDPSFVISSGIRQLRDVIDPVEALVRGDHVHTESPLSGTRFTQRTEVFEGLLKFVSDEEKQPSESLLDIVEKDRSTRSAFLSYQSIA